MSKFSKENFYRVILEIEKMELSNQNIWVPIGILEYTYDDNVGAIDCYFHSPIEDRNIEKLWKDINK